MAFANTIYQLQSHAQSINNLNNSRDSFATKFVAVDKEFLDQSAKIQTLEANLTAQTITEVALRAEIDTLKLQQPETAARLDTQKKESDTKIKQLQDLSLACIELMEMVKKGQSDSNSFYDSSRASSRASTVKADDDTESVDLLIIKFEGE